MKLSKELLKDIILAIGTGIIVGIVFQLLEFPLPAPNNIAAFMGIFGVWAGATIVKRVQATRGERR